ncbi:hypothetical protein [Nocardia yunnanensis]|uniref:hypothetical protein n=1 Tax=Nocardia yunnanensis TaxID=2382165 RepID=UPI001CA46A89|nr:hypothetical protein [Nocardia yunnanensis]
MTATQHMVGEADRFHRAALRALEPQRDACLYACEQLHAAEIEPTGPEVRQWLADHGRQVGRTTVWKAVSEYRSEHGLPDLDDARGLFSAGGVNTEQCSEQTTEQPSGGTTVFTLEQTEPIADPAPAAADRTPERGSSEQPTEQPDPVNVTDETTERRPRRRLNAALVELAAARRKGRGLDAAAVMADSGHMGTSADSAESEQEDEAEERAGVTAPQARPSRALPTWPVLLMAFPAFVAIWSGWVGLGELTGFGVVHPLPGIADDFTINSAITLPIGVEAYASYALYVWLSGRINTKTTRTYAMVSAFASLGIGAAGQVAYHVMEARHITSAPWQIITMVACLPVAVVGMGAILAHLIVRERHIVNA